MTTKFTS